MGLLDADKAQRIEKFGDDTDQLLDLVEHAFGVEFTEDELLAATTVGLLSNCISQKLAQHSEDGCDSASTVIFPNLRQLIAAEIGMKAEKISPETCFPEGLKIF